MFLFFSCKRLCDLKKDLPELFDQKVFMEELLVPSITHKELNDFIKESFDLEDLKSIASLHNGLSLLPLKKKLYETLKTGSITNTIFYLIN